LLEVVLSDRKTRPQTLKDEHELQVSEIAKRSGSKKTGLNGQLRILNKNEIRDLNRATSVVRKVNYGRL